MTQVQEDYSTDKENQQEAFRQQKQLFLQKMSQEMPKRYKKCDIKDVLQINKQTVHFGQVIPGNICEDEIQFLNLSSDPLIINIQVICENSEFDELDEYVYSARKLNGYDYNDRFMLACPPQKQFVMKVALKVPNVKEQKGIAGSVLISTQYGNHQKIQGQFIVSIQSQIMLPLIECPKTLLHTVYNLPVIQLAFKLGRKLDCKIPFKNNSPNQLPIECDFLNRTDGELVIQPNTLVAQSNQQFFITLYVKSKQEQNLKNVLILKIKNSSVHFSFPILIKIY